MVVVANANVLHQAPDAPPLKYANARLPHVVNLGGKHLNESVAAVLNVGPYKERHFCVTQSINQSGMAEIPSYISTEFDLFERKARQDGCLETTETIYKPIASVDQKDIEFLIPADSDTLTQI